MLEGIVSEISQAANPPSFCLLLSTSCCFKIRGKHGKWIFTPPKIPKAVLTNHKLKDP